MRLARNERGRGKLGCLFMILLVVLGAYYSIPVGQAYFAYASLRDEMRTQAQFAATLDDATIVRRVVQRMDEFALIPNEARQNLQVFRTDRPPFQIIVRTSYDAYFDFPFYQYRHTFSIEVRRPL